MPSKYDVEVTDGASCVVVDVYEICRACQVACGATQHAVKKLLFAGRRGVKDRMQDLTEARAAIDRAIELEQLPPVDDGRAANTTEGGDAHRA